MVPATFPVNASLEWRVFEIDPTGLVRWTDWIPVDTGSAGGERTYNDAGEMVIETLLDVTGLVAWVDYTPVDFVTAAAGKLWRVDSDGAIPVIDPA